MDPLSLSVFFPCYNEEANVERTTEAALKACQSVTTDFEIIIVNDGSRDRTGELADQLAARHEKVRAVHNPTNHGYGSALQAGFKSAGKEWVFYTDGDGQFDLAEITRLVGMLGSHDIVSAYRIRRKDSLVRRINGWGWTLLCNLLLGMRLKDIDCAFKIYPRRLFDQIEMWSEGALIDAEILAKANRLGYRIPRCQNQEE
jgi:glycosyltransferase involved in cell wall biosynthesis